MGGSYIGVLDAGTDEMTDLIERARAALDGVTPGRAVQFHPKHCAEAVGAQMPKRGWDTSHDVSVIRDDGCPYPVGEFRHARDAAFYQAARDLVPDLAAALEKAEAERDTAEAARSGLVWARDYVGAKWAAAEDEAAVLRARVAELEGALTRICEQQAMPPYVCYNADLEGVISKARATLRAKAKEAGE